MAGQSKFELPLNEGYFGRFNETKCFFDEKFCDECNGGFRFINKTTKICNSCGTRLNAYGYGNTKIKGRKQATLNSAENKILLSEPFSQFCKYDVIACFREIDSKKLEAEKVRKLREKLLTII